MSTREVMDLDDDYVVIVVKNNQDQSKAEIEEQKPEIKTEVLEEEYEDYSVDQLRAILEGSPVNEYPEVPVIIKEENNTDVEDESTNLKEHYTEYEEIYTDMEVLDTDVDEEEIYEPIQKTINIKKKNKRRDKGKKVISFVENLISQEPQLKTDKKGLICALLEKMQSIKAPLVEDFAYEYDENRKYFICTVCNYENNYKPAFDRHYLEKHGPRYLFCFTCGTTFRSNTNLYKHERRCITPYTKVVLQARSLYVGAKSKHRPPVDIKIELPAKPNNKHKYTKRRIGNINVYTCSLCPATFKVKKSLEAHELMHEGVRPFQCEHCSCAYTSKSKLTKHMYKHSDKVYICDLCGFEFKYKTALAAHLYTHYEPRFLCPECPRRYTHKAAMQLHIHKVHRKLPPPCACQMCPKRFNRMWYLKHHMKKVHGMHLITRQMFFKYLPRLSDTTAENAKLVMHSEAPAIHAKELGELSDRMLQARQENQTSEPEETEDQKIDQRGGQYKLNFKTGKLRKTNVID